MKILETMIINYLILKSESFLIAHSSGTKSESSLILDQKWTTSDTNVALYGTKLNVCMICKPTTLVHYYLLITGYAYPKKWSVHLELTAMLAYLG